jgi:lysophospholipase L1-like esterase
MKKLLWIFLLAAPLGAQTLTSPPPASLGYCYYAAGKEFLPIAGGSGGSIVLTNPPPASLIFGNYAAGPNYQPLQCDSGGNLIISGGSSALVVGTTPITSGTVGQTLYDNNGVLGSGGNAATATALAATPAQCPAGQVATGVTAAGVANCASAFTALTGDAMSTSTGGATTVQGLKNVPFCTGYTPTNGQAVTLTTASSPNPCYTAVAGSPASLTPYGSIYSNNNFSSLSPFTVNGATAATEAAGSGSCPAGTNSCIQISAGAGNFAESVDYTYQTTLPIWTVSMTQVAGTKSSSSYGLGLGIRSNAQLSTSVSAQYSVVAQIDTSSGASAGTVSLAAWSGGNVTQIVASGTKLTITAGDSLLFTVTRIYDTIYFTGQDVTSAATPVTVSYTFPFSYSPNGPYLPNEGRFSIFSVGGTQTVTSLSISSGVPLGTDVMCLGDSKTIGQYAGSYSAGWCEQLTPYYRSFPLSGGYDTSADIISNMPEILALKPKAAIIMIGGNDLGNSISLPTVEANITTIVSDLAAAGITPYCATYPLQNAGANVTSLNTWILANCTSFNANPPGMVSGSVWATWIAPDNVHPVAPWHNYIAQQALAFLQAQGLPQQQPGNIAIKVQGGTIPVQAFGVIQGGTINTATNCSSSASPAICGSAAAGSVALPTNAVSSSIVVNTTAVTANSQILVTTDDTLGTKLGVTCNSTVATLVGGLTISARTAGTSFTIANNVAVVTNPLCVSYLVIN